MLRLEPFREIFPLLSQPVSLPTAQAVALTVFGRHSTWVAWLGQEIWKVNSQRSYPAHHRGDDTELCSHLRLQVRREPWLSERAAPASSPAPEPGCHPPRKGQKLRQHSQCSGLSCVLELWDPSMPPRKTWGLPSGLLLAVAYAVTAQTPFLQ